jgi:hypothetical protein
VDRSAASDPILVAGGDRDPNVAVLVRALEAAGAAVRPLLYGAGARPWLAWDLDGDRLILDGDVLQPRAVFLRHDVFTQLADPRPEPGFRAMAWTTALHGWVLAHPEVRCLNRVSFSSVPNKPHALLLARELGLAIPRTVITNSARVAREVGDAIAKPVAGGELTHPLDHALAKAGDADVLAAPALVQERLVAPELRVYVVGDATFTFEVGSPLLDYRASPDVELTYLGPGPAAVADRVRALARRLGLDFAAADLKSRPGGELVFLEINTAPMFARFDHAAGGALAHALAGWLVDGPRGTLAPMSEHSERLSSDPRSAEPSAAQPTDQPAAPKAVP